MRGYLKWKDEALDFTTWRTRFGRGYGQDTERIPLTTCYNRNVFTGWYELNVHTKFTLIYVYNAKEP
jgi:hypothetical protein